MTIKWADIVRWVYNATVTAEELGVTSSNVDSMKNSNNPEILRMLGVEGSQGEELGLSKDWAYQIIKQVGNYSEIFERNIGDEHADRLGTRVERPLDAWWSPVFTTFPLIFVITNLDV